MVQFRCPHNGPDADFPSEAAKAEARRQLFDVPADAIWEPAGKKGDVSETSVTTRVTCPLCGQELRIYTDQEVG